MWGKASGTRWRSTSISSMLASAASRHLVECEKFSSVTSCDLLLLAMEAGCRNFFVTPANRSETHTGYLPVVETEHHRTCSGELARFSVAQTSVSGIVADRLMSGANGAKRCKTKDALHPQGLCESATCIARVGLCPRILQVLEK